MGMLSVAKEEYEEKAEQINLITKMDLYMMEDISSIPFQIDFEIPVSKVTCGDSFTVLLSAEG